MARALVVFESMFGNTEAVARAVADGIATVMDVDVVRVGAAPTTIADDVDLLVVGAPTHVFGLSRASTRAAAVDQGAQPVTGSERGVREWLAALPPSPGATGVTAFDTRVRKPGVPGSAARVAIRRLRRLGFSPTAGATSFYVTGTEGPLTDGETARARSWGAVVAREAVGNRATSA